MRILFAVPPAHGLMFPVVPLMWAARVAGHDILVATTAEMVEAGSRAGLPMVDVVPNRADWSNMMHAVISGGDRQDLPEEYRLAVTNGNPFAFFALTMTEGTMDIARAFGADLVVHTSDHAPGRLTAVARGIPAVEVGNRVSWSVRDEQFHAQGGIAGLDEAVRRVRGTLGVGEHAPALVARIDPRAPSMGGLAADEPDPRDGVPWWPMRFVPYNGGATVPGWALLAAERPRVCVTLGTVVPRRAGIGILPVLVSALAGLDVDAVLAAGDADLSGLGTLPERIRPVGFLPLSTFLAGCSLIVHHGGSGTTAAALHYGVPQLVLPRFADNPVSAQRVVDRGVGLSLDPQTADVPAVRAAVQRLLGEPDFAAAAREVRAEMATQPSPSAVIERIVGAMITRGCLP